MKFNKTFSNPFFKKHAKQIVNNIKQIVNKYCVHLLNNKGEGYTHNTFGGSVSQWHSRALHNQTLHIKSNFTSTLSHQPLLRKEASTVDSEVIIKQSFINQFKMFATLMVYFMILP